MSYSIYLQRFSHGEAAPMDDNLGHALVAPYVVSAKPEHGLIRIRANDGGEATLYTSEGSIMVNRFAWGGILDIVSELARQLMAVILLLRGSPFLSTAEDR